jgi:hypothetical protein
MICHVKCVPHHNGMPHHRVAFVGDGLQMWGVATNVLNKSREQPRRHVPSACGDWSWG